MNKNDKLKILFEDKYIIIVSKPFGLLTIGTDKEKDNTLYRKVSDYVKKQHKSNKIFIVHRLDRDTSGIVMFAKDEKTKRILQNNWSSFKRKYVALVEGTITESGTIKNYLAETRTLHTYITNNNKLGKLAITKYEPIISNKKYTLLNIEILTGRKNQIRVHLSSINHPIIGDTKYENNKKQVRRMYLHANEIIFIHPITNKSLRILDEYPDLFNHYVK